MQIYFLEFPLMQNNSPTNNYGTALLVRNDLITSNIKCDTNGRAIIFGIVNVTFYFFIFNLETKER